MYRRACLLVIAVQVLVLLLGLCGLRLSGLAIDIARRTIDAGAPVPAWPLGWVPAGTWTPRRLLFLIGALVLGLAMARSILSYGGAVTSGKLLHLRLVPELRARVFDKLQRLSFRFFDENASGSIINRVTGDVQAVRTFVDGVLLPGSITLLSLPVYLAYMLRTQVWLTVACLAPTPVVWFLTGRFIRWSRPAYHKSRALGDDMVLAMSEGIHGIQITKVFGREDHDLAKFRAKSRAVLDQQGRIMRRVSRLGPSVQFIGQIQIAILLCFGGTLVARGSMTLGDLIVFSGLLQQFSERVSAIADIMNTLQQSLTAAGRVFEVLDAPVEVQSPDHPVRPSTIRGAVCFERVTFSYDAAKPVLRKIDFQVQPGECAAIFGVTGAGKSTLLELIPRFHDPRGGRVMVDGVDVRTFDLQTLRRSIGLVFQENLLFRSTIAQNIAFGHPEAGRDLIERAARLAGAEEFIRALPDGYDTLIEEGAANLSGGQRQRIAIARALLLEPPILLLDDPTTAIDSQTEHEVLSAIEDAVRGRTTVIVANRLTTLRRADIILVLHDGRIVQRGTHKELMAVPGIYLQAASLQVADIESADPRDATGGDS